MDPSSPNLVQLLGRAVTIAGGEPLARRDAADVRSILERALLGPRASLALQWLLDQGVVARLLPELAATVGFDRQIEQHHKDLWAHTKRVVEQSPPIEAVRWAALLHDIGKVPTRGVSDGGRVTFHGHPEQGARLFDDIARRLDFPPSLEQRVRSLILHHQRPGEYDGQWTDGAVRRLCRDLGPSLDDLLLLSRADITSAQPARVEAATRQLDELEIRVRTLRELDSRRPPLPSGLGNALIERFGLEPGPRVGQLKRQLEQRVADGTLEPGREAGYYIGYLEGVGAREPGD